MNKFLLSISFVFAFMFFGYGQTIPNMFYSGDLNGFAGESMTFRFGPNTWIATLQAPSNDMTSNFLFRDSDSNFNNKWSRGTEIPFSSLDTAFWQGGDTSINVTENRYYTFVLSNVNFDSDGNLIVHETEAEPVTINTVQDIGTTTVAPGQQVSVDVTLSETPSANERIYLIYTTDSFATRTGIEVTGFGSTNSSSVGLPSFSPGTEVTYYVISTTLELNLSETGGDYYDIRTINLNNNGGINYTYTVDSSWETIAGADTWSNPSSWAASEVPVANQPVTINDDITLNTDATISSLTINSGATFNATDGSDRTLTISKSTSGNQTTFENNGTWNNGAANSTIVFSGEPNSGDAIHQIRGTSATGFFNITVNKTGGTNNVGADFENSSVSGTLEIGTGGFISTAPPSGFYTEDAILLFNQGASANFVVNAGGFTWSTTEIPNNITVQSGTVTLDDNRDVSSEILINSDATLSINTGNTLTSTGLITNNGSININGDLVFKSTASGTAQYGNSTGTITGDVTVERFIPKRSDDARAFRFLASPVGDVNIAGAWQQQTHITGAAGTVGQTSTDGFDETESGAASMFTFDHSIENQVATSAWTPIASTTQDIVAGKPYRLFVRGDRSSTNFLTNNSEPAVDVSLSAKGTLHTENFSVTTSNFSENYTFIGNPYQAVVNLNNLTYGDGVNKNTAYYWDPSIGTNGGFVTITLSDGSNDIESPSSSNADQFLRPGQAVFIKNNNTGTDYSIQFNEEDKATTGSQTQVFSVGETPAFINARVYKTAKYNAGFMEEDAFGLRFSVNGNNEINQLDASKFGNPGINLASVNNNQLFSIENRALPNEDELISLFMNNLTTDNYTFHFNIQNFEETTDIFLKDKYTNEMIALETGINEIQFSADEAITESVDILRFELVFGNTTLSQTDFAQNSFSIYPNPAEDVLNINWNETPNEEMQISIFNLVGKKVAEFSQSASDEVTSLPINSLNAGVYLLQIQNEDVNVTKKFIKK